jgi:hypothetical protein
LFHAFAPGEDAPAVVRGQSLFLAGFVQHFDEQQVGQFGVVLVVGDAVVAQDVAQAPEFGDDVGGGGHFQVPVVLLSSAYQAHIGTSFGALGLWSA